MFRTAYILIFILCVQIISIAQNDTINYKKADSIAINLRKNFKTVRELSLALTSELTTEHEKFRAIFMWIATNLTYKPGAYSKKNAYKVMKRKKAVCEGYAFLLKELCYEAGIKCEYIVGYSKSNPMDDIGNSMKTSTHAWNAVMLNGKWHLTDPTWASGYYDSKKRKFIREFDSFYFLPDPEDLILNHYPNEKKWLLTETRMGKREFKLSPVIYPAYAEMNIEPQKKIKNHFKKKIKFKLKSGEIISDATITIISANEKVTTYGTDIEKKGNIYHIKCVLSKEDKLLQGKAYLYINNKQVLGLRKK